MKIDGNEIKVGNILEINKKLWRVHKTQHTQPGKGGAYIQAELKEIKDGTKMNTRFRSSESVERAIMDEKNFQYLYKDNDKFIFMDQQTYEQIEIGSDLIDEDQSKYLIENDEVILQFYNDKPVGLELPINVTLPSNPLGPHVINIAEATIDPSCDIQIATLATEALHLATVFLAPVQTYAEEPYATRRNAECTKRCMKDMDCNNGKCYVKSNIGREPKELTEI